tara:strand:+ start:52 stop:1716 length:1665 start_codon:yes stop_codon:yes gene_type:complete
MKINSKVLSLKYRPILFDDLIGQDVVKDTISNAIKENKVPNAYLFTGIRGVGKTTTARLVAKALNCKNGIENLCKENFCDNCHAITNSNHIDVLEMDAASKTGVDDVRELIEFSRYGPSIAKYKIFIIDEVHMLSKQAFNALLKTLEEPPQYHSGGSLKFIFATTEIKKIPITVVSRCQRFDLGRVKSNELFEFIKKIKEIEKGKISDEALKLIVNISEGSVRDALSLLDKAIISNTSNNETSLEEAQKIFGCFDKSKLITLFKYIFEGDEDKVLREYRLIYNQGIEPKVFLNDFLEILYFFKNINSLKIESTNFTLNDQQFLEIKKLVEKIDNKTIILFWQFTINVMEEIDIVSNQNLSIEMFLMRLLYLEYAKKATEGEDNDIDDTKIKDRKFLDNKEKNNLNNNTVDQIKNLTQEENKKIDIKKKIDDKIQIKSLADLINICEKKKEIKLKYELETNFNLVSFEDKRIEISFNDNLDKSFIKILSSKLFEWTNQRWIISLSQKAGEISIKDLKKNIEKQNLQDATKTATYKKIIETFPDAELISIDEDKLK